MKKRNAMFFLIGFVPMLLMGGLTHLALADPGQARRMAQTPPVFLPVPGAQPVAAESKKLGPVACAVVRMHLRREYRAAGKSFAESVRLANQADDDVINGMVADAEKVAQAKVKDAKFGAIGDGSIIQAIIDFFKSPAGAALLQALLQMLIHLIGGL